MVTYPFIREQTGGSPASGDRSGCPEQSDADWRVLRKVISLGGKSGSDELRDWAARELRGCGPDDELPPYRRTAAPLIELYDDLDNTPIPKGEGETVTFELDRIQYEIDLSRNNAVKLRDELAPFVGAARKVGGGDGRRRRGGVRAAPRNAEQLQAIRQWAKKQGMKVADRGRISADVEKAYHAAH